MLKRKKIVKVKSKKRTGKRPLLNEKQVMQLKKMYKTVQIKNKDLCKKFNISIPTLYNYLKR